MTTEEKLVLYQEMMGELLKAAKKIDGTYAEGYCKAVEYLKEMLLVTFPEIKEEEAA